MSAINRSQLWKKKLGDWVVNPYVGCKHGCVFCYCPAMPGVKFFNGGKSQAEWGEYVIPLDGNEGHKDIVGELRQQLRQFTAAKARKTAWGDGWVLMSFLTDCYQPIEAELKLTRQCLQLLLEAGHRVRIQTRSALVERDFDLIKAHPGQVLLGTSLPSLDDALTKVLEPHATGIKRRLVMMDKAAATGIPLYFAIAPVMPWTFKDQLCELIETAAKYSPKEIFCEVLNPKGSNLGMVVEALDEFVLHHEKAMLLSSYDGPAWARFTHETLRNGWCRHPNFVPWPDTKRAWQKHIPGEQADWLSQFLPAVDVEQEKTEGTEK